MIDRELAAKKIRERLEQRLALFFQCKTEELPRLKLGTLVHTAFLLWGHTEELGGFNTTIHAVLQFCGHEIVWKDEEKKEESPAVVN